MLILIIMSLGYLGMIMLALGFYLISNGYLNARSLSYQIIQCIGCLFVAVDAFFKGAYPSMFLQIICMFIAFNTINNIINSVTKDLEDKIEKSN